MSTVNKRITQETFNEAVEENIREFGMTREEAIADAIQQFEANNVDLTNIVRDTSDPNAHPVIRSLRLVKEWTENSTYPGTTSTNSNTTPDTGMEENVLDSLICLTVELPKTAENKAIARSHGGVAYLTIAIEKTLQLSSPTEGGNSSSSSSTHSSSSSTVSTDNCTDVNNNDLPLSPSPSLSRSFNLLKSSMDALRILCYGYDEARNEVQNTLPPLILQIASNSNNSSEIRRSALLLCAILCVKREKTKTQLFEAGLPHAVSGILQTCTTPTASNVSSSSYDDTSKSIPTYLVAAACIALCRLLTDDDMNVMASNAYAFARTIGKEGMPKLLLKTLNKYNTNAVVAAEVFAALRSIIVNDEICREIDGLGGIDIVTANLAPHVASKVITDTVVVLSNVSGNVSSSASSSSSSSSSSSASNTEEVQELVEAVAAAELNDDTNSTVGGTSVAETDAMSITASTIGNKSMKPSNQAQQSGPHAGSGNETNNQRRIRMVRCGFAVLRSLANSDPNKIKMGEGPTLNVLLQALDTMMTSPSVLDQVIAVLGNLCLRLPDNCARVHTLGGFPLLARAMRTHIGHLGLQRSACLALRNMIVKSPDRIQAAFDEGFENLLQQTYMQHPAARDVSYACLRDMGVEYAETVIGRAQAERAQRALVAGDIRVK